MEISSRKLAVLLIGGHHEPGRAGAPRALEIIVEQLEALAAELGERLKAQGQTVAVAESSSGGLISAALLSVPGASKYYLGGAVVYTGKARTVLMDVPLAT